MQYFDITKNKPLSRSIELPGRLSANKQLGAWGMYNPNFPDHFKLKTLNFKLIYTRKPRKDSLPVCFWAF